jgi:predicted secreted hydrolase
MNARTRPALPENDEKTKFWSHARARARPALPRVPLRRPGFLATLLLAALLLALAGPAVAQGYAGLGTEAEGFAPVERPADLRFPRDHGPHPGHRIEWWYLTAALDGADGRDYGVQWTLFRVATRPGPEAEGWGSTQIWIGHAGLTAEDDHRHAERFARGGTGQAGVTAEPFAAWIDDWTLASEAPPGADPMAAVRLAASGEGFAYELAGAATGPLVRHGEAGFSLKAEAGQASYYYSQPFLRLEGTLTIDGAETAVAGTGWIDREWSSQHMSPDQTGWDWFSLHLDDGARLMAYRLRETEGPSYTFGTWIAPDGAARALAAGEVVMEPRAWAEVAGRELPVAWRLEAPALALAVDTEPVNPQSWMGGNFPYWEGPIRVAGTHAGRGYLEMVGY